jgi:ABC-type glycerol-3-phosphate transport system substrate-binding protein
VVLLPLSGDLMMLYYRTDVFAAYNLTVPQTWEQFVDIAEKMNSTDFNGDGKKDFSLCMSAYASALATKADHTLLCVLR